MKKRKQFSSFVVKVFLPGFLVLSVVACDGDGSRAGKAPKPIPNGVLYPSEALRVFWNSLVNREEPVEPECGEFLRVHPVDFSRPVAHVEIPQHPFMARNPGNNMHCDASMSDTYEASGPMGIHPRVTSRTQGFGGYGTLAYDRADRIVAVYGNGKGFQLELMDPYTLVELASYDLPSRPWYFLFQGVLPWKYIGAGMYFYLDNQDRAVVPTTDNRLLIIRTPEAGSRRGFGLVRTYDLSEHVVPLSWPRQDSVAWVLPEWSGEYYWFATTEGVVGTVHAASGSVQRMQLEGERIENSFAVGEDGIFIISDAAMYRFSRDGAGSILRDWRTAYDPGGQPKPGHITRGSGTSVTLMGGHDGLVSIADNAEPRINLLFLKRSDGTVVCSLPVFEEDRSGTDLTTIGFDHADAKAAGTGVYSVIVENNRGNHSFPRSRPVAGLTRVDAERHEDGTYSCKEIWASREKSIGGFRLSFGNGLVYMYLKRESCPTTRWYFTALDFTTGETVYRKLTGTGLGYNNWQGSLFLHPDGGAAYSTTIFGLVMIRDSDP